MLVCDGLLSIDCGEWRSVVSCFFFQAEDGIRDLVRSRGLGDVYKRQGEHRPLTERELAGGGVVDERPGDVTRHQVWGELHLSLIHI